MRIKAIRLAWFRGAADPVALQPEGKSMVVYGQNGAGKSSFIDAVEYVLNSGKLAHLTHEYSGRHQENAIPNTHTPPDRGTEFWITFADDSELNVKIARTGTYTMDGLGMIDMGMWDYRRTVLRQDEVSQFIHRRKGEKYSALLPLFGLRELEIAAENLHQLGRSIEQRAKLAQKQGVLQQSIAKRKQAFGAASAEAIETKIGELHEQYCPDSTSMDALVRCKELEAALVGRLNTFNEENQHYLVLRGIVLARLVDTVKSVREANAKLADSVEPLIAEKLAVLRSADAFTAKLSDAGEVDCPACGRTILVSQFKFHVKNEQARLREIIVVFDERRSAIGTLIDRIKTIKGLLAKPDVSAWRDALKEGTRKVHIEWIEQFDPESLRQELREEDLGAIEDNCIPIIGAAEASSQNAPPDIRSLTGDQSLVQAARGVFEASELAGEISRIEGLNAFVHSMEGGIRVEIRERSQSVIDQISGDIGSMWRALHPGEPIDNVRLYLPENDKAVDVALKFHGKDQDSPRLTLSEGYRNSLGLCIFLAMAKREAATDRPVFLDDVVISLDRNHRGMIVQLLLDEFSQRQVIILTHDRDWYAELRQQLDERRWSFRALLPYETPALGIRWSHKTTTFDDARALLKERPDSAANDARKIMDSELALIAEKLQVRLPYMRGDRNDKRMWSDFLERILADGKKCLQKKDGGGNHPSYGDGLVLLDQAGRLLVSWANKGSHSHDVMRSEAEKLIDGSL